MQNFKSIKTNFRLFASYFKMHTKWIILGAILVLIQSILILPIPLISRYIIDVIIPGKNTTLLIFCVILVLAVLAVLKSIDFIQSLIFYKVNQRVGFDIKLELLKKINKLPMSKKKEFGTGYLIARVDNDVQRLENIFADTLISVVKDVFTMLVGLIAIFIIHWKLAFASVCILPCFIYMSMHFSKKIRNLSKEFFENQAQTTRRLEESLNMVELVKSFSRYKYNILRYFQKAKIAFRSNIKMGKISFLNSAVTSFLSGLAPIIIIGYGGYEIIQGRLSIGSIIAFNSFIGYLLGPTSRLINVNIKIQTSLVALGRIKEIFNLPEEKADQNFIFPEKNFRLDFNNITFSYTKKEPVLRNISFTAFSGEKIGIVGSSGSGKTTLLRIIAGLYIPESGQISLNGQPLSDSQLISIREHIAIVEQEPYLFNDTIYNNIRLGNPKAIKEEINKVAEQAYCNVFINELPSGYDTLVGFNGSNLSVGQKQRIAIARSIIKEPKILILDEATSNIDSISEKYIKKTISLLTGDMITFIVAHRLNTIRYCDKIIVIEDGQIVEEGNHKLLLQKRGIYEKYFLNFMQERR